MSKWLSHVKSTMKSNKGKSFSQVLKIAAKTYKKRGGGDVAPHNDFGSGADISSAGPNSASPFHPSDAASVGGRRRSRGGRKSRRATRRGGTHMGY